ncbi:MAG: hypothetical protein WKF84_24695 [Pyrinomonadaceae bacterium]
MVALFGETVDALSISEYAASVEGTLSPNRWSAKQGLLPVLDLERECAVQNAVLRAIDAGLLSSAHTTVRMSGLAVALAESCFSSLNRRALGASVELASDLSAPSTLFGEAPSRISRQLR